MKLCFCLFLAQTISLLCFASNVIPLWDGNSRLRVRFLKLKESEEFTTSDEETSYRYSQIVECLKEYKTAVNTMLVEIIKLEVDSTDAASADIVRNLMLLQTLENHLMKNILHEKDASSLNEPMFIRLTSKQLLRVCWIKF